ncbi:hypothetical protein QTP88_007200 [Uroleucon formosanum]
MPIETKFFVNILASLLHVVHLPIQFEMDYKLQVVFKLYWPVNNSIINYLPRFLIKYLQCIYYSSILCSIMNKCRVTILNNIFSSLNVKQFIITIFNFTLTFPDELILFSVVLIMFYACHEKIKALETRSNYTDDEQGVIDEYQSRYLLYFIISFFGIFLEKVLWKYVTLIYNEMLDPAANYIQLNYHKYVLSLIHQSRGVARIFFLGKPAIKLLLINVDVDFS